MRKRPFEWLSGKTLVWTSWLRVFCDAGWPKMFCVPRFRRAHYDPFWGLSGFAVVFLGREFNVAVGRDKNGLYESLNAPHEMRSGGDDVDNGSEDSDGFDRWGFGVYA